MTEKQWKALSYEYKTVKSWDKNWERPIWNASLRRVALLVGVSHTAIAKWRANPAYIQGFKWLIAQEVAKRLDERDPKT